MSKYLHLIRCRKILICCGTKKVNAIIIDPGCYFTAEEETLENFIKEKNLKPVQLINTHCHLDHVFGNKWVAKNYHLELFIHPDEKKYLNLRAATGVCVALVSINYKGALHFLEEGDIINLGEDKLENNSYARSFSRKCLFLLRSDKIF